MRNPEQGFTSEEKSSNERHGISRRDFLKLGAATAIVGGLAVQKAMAEDWGRILAPVFLESAANAAEKRAQKKLEAKTLEITKRVNKNTEIGKFLEEIEEKDAKEQLSVYLPVSLNKITKKYREQNNSYYPA